MTLIYLYITFFTLYIILLGALSLKSERKIRDKYTPKDSNLCVVVYATGECPTLPNLIQQLKAQSYPQSRYTTYVILDKCMDVSEVTLQTETNINVISINNLEPIGKSQAYSIIAEKLHDVRELDSYVFLSAKNYIDSDFLTNINYYLTKYNVFNPAVTYISDNKKMSFWQNVKTVYSMYKNSFYNRNRVKLGFTDIINTDSFVIKRDLLNKIAIFDFNNIMSEVKYTYQITKEKEYVAYISDLKVFKSVNDFELRIPSLSQRLKLLWSNILKADNLKSKEFLISMASPNWFCITFGYFLLLNHAFHFPFWIDYSTILITFIILMIALCVSFMNSTLYLKEFPYLFMYPVYSSGVLIYNFPLLRLARDVYHKLTRKHVIDKMTTNIIVSDGRKDFSCQLELISDDGLAKVTFINNGKKYTTKNNHLRMVDAIKELTDKLDEYGLILKICQCCKYFQPVVDGSTNMVKGCCNCNFEGRVPGDMIPTLIWNTCPRFEKNNVINLF